MPDPDFVIPFERLPERFAESVEHPPDEPAVPRPAATVVLMRDADVGPEVLLMRRNRSAGFVPGAYVFPGGRVDRSDANEALLELVDGLTADAASARLELWDGDPPAIAYYLAALREAFEETGILVAAGPEGDQPPTAKEDAVVDELRDEVMEARIPFAEALRRMECRITGAAVEYFAHWITPEPEPRRYDTRFFAAKVRRGARPIVDPREMTDGVWITPRAALERNVEGALPLVFPTIKTLEQLERFETVDAALSALARAHVRTNMPTLVITPTGIGMQLDEDG